jgi:hypothetical protein
MPVFVNYEMTKPEEAMMRKAGNTLESVFDFIEKMVGDGYKVSFRHDDYNDCAQASLTAPSGDNPNSNLCLTQRGGSVSKALLRLFYVHSVIFEGTWPQPGERNAWVDDWK